MAATVKILTPAQWKAFREVLGGEEGVVLIPPKVAKELKLREAAGMFLMNYDFGGDADIFVEIVYDEDHYAVEVIRDEIAKVGEELLDLAEEANRQVYGE